jgi:hypothetical protein
MKITGLRGAILVCAMTLLSSAALRAQDAVPTEMLSRTVAISTDHLHTYGTAFNFDYEGKVYLVTARHVVVGVSASNATIQIFRSGNWVDLHPVKTLYPPTSDAEIAVFETDEKVTQPYTVTLPAGGDGPTLGQQVWFLGYPRTGTKILLGSHFSNGDYPFTKRGLMPAIDATNINATVLYVDGFNNPGFSGGPILYWSFNAHQYKILGVIQGYEPDSAKVNGKQVDTPVLVNSGIAVGYEISPGLHAIQSSSPPHTP